MTFLAVYDLSLALVTETELHSYRTWVKCLYHELLHEKLHRKSDGNKQESSLSPSGAGIMHEGCPARKNKRVVTVHLPRDTFSSLQSTSQEMSEGDGSDQLST